MKALHDAVQAHLPERLAALDQLSMTAVVLGPTQDLFGASTALWEPNAVMIR